MLFLSQRIPHAQERFQEGLALLQPQSQVLLLVKARNSPLPLLVEFVLPLQFRRPVILQTIRRTSIGGSAHGF